MTDLKDFKVQDAMRNPGVRQTKIASAEGEEIETESLGFPRIEAEVENDGPMLVGMQQRYEQLIEMSTGGTSAKEKAAAKNSALAYARAINLIDHLLETKTQMSAADDEG